MKVLMLNALDQWGGAARAALRLHEGMRRMQVDSQMLVQTKAGETPGVFSDDSTAGRHLKFLRPHLDLLPVRYYPQKPLLNFSPAWWPDRVTRQVVALQPDLLHLHWVTGGFLRVETLTRLHRLGKPILWTLHDSWAFTGGCHVPFECIKYRDQCGACPVLGSRAETDLSRWIWRRKNAAWQNVDLTVVTPSRWLADCARSSSLLRKRRIEVIPNGLDMAAYRPMERRQARTLLSLPQDRTLVLYGGMGIDLLANKGSHLVMAATRLLAQAGWGEKAELVVFGSSGPREGSSPNFKVHHLGWLPDDASLTAAYSAADLAVIPSLLENFPNTALEAMACGVPCVAFAQGGMAQLIEHGQSGYLAQPYSVDDLAEGIRVLLTDDDLRLRMGRNARQKAEDAFALETVCRSYLDLYRDLLGTRS